MGVNEAGRVNEAGNGAGGLGAGVLRAGRLEVRPAEHAALVDGSPMHLTVKELALLTELAAHPDRILTREELYVAVWGGALRSGDRSVDVYVSRLRSKLQRAMPEHPFIHTHFGVGYRFDPA
jgi:two-component system alkaline phosphatase synthesis response regulator PhoP